MPKRFTMTLEPDDYERLRKIAYVHDRPVAAEARNLLLTELAAECVKAAETLDGLAVQATDGTEGSKDDG